MAAMDADAAAREALAGQPVDMLAQAADGRRKKLLVSDMESTIIDNEMIDELAGELGLHERMAELTARTMRGELEFAESLIARVQMLEGLDASVLEKFKGNIRVIPGARELVATMRANGAYCALVSGGFTFYSEYVRELVGFDYDQANRLEIVDDKLTGRIVKPVLDRHAKQACLVRIAGDLGLSLSQAVAVGDGANDLAMVLAAGLGAAYRGKPILAEAAALRVDHGDLTALLYAQGYREAEIVGRDG
jgi:phosphoserine phosphatase